MRFYDPAMLLMLMLMLISLLLSPSPLLLMSPNGTECDRHDMRRSSSRNEVNDPRTLSDRDRPILMLEEELKWVMDDYILFNYSYIHLKTA